MQLPNHGANPEHLVRSLHLSQSENTIDFSVNTNPFPLQNHIIANWNQYIESISKYPDPSSEQFIEFLSTKENVQRNQLLLGNGAAQLIYLLAMYFQKKKVAILEPTFSEYREACVAFGCDIEGIIMGHPWELNKEKLVKRCQQKDVLFICNPNNPTGVSYPPEDLIHVIQKLSSYNVTVIIDEAFFDFQEHGTTLIQLVNQYDNLIILRSLTKMYGLAGLRLGFMAANETVIASVSKLQHPWSINGLAQQIGLECLQDDVHVRNTQEFMKNERLRLFPLLEELGYEVSNSQVNYYLLKEKDKKEDCLALIKFLIVNGIIPRHTYNFVSLQGQYIRLAIKTTEENNYLLNVLRRWRETC
ncbi:threonine-phosphate decarboxylase [Anaerobacillus alkaliphilus]|uniref:threonine-phosphate decarboxylase n=1 Tax=Anaerobacillus alkaliphilus TaxID=1548597 RepID=A0A4V1LGT8_9BACI|nr:threonine-phosphate decarboxylase CobD [Anaerobacillus alkaliphilus]RXJ03885.1 threonine-phosphate decarboxylase [Anaerobacillus alkaliphilus]